MLLKELLNPLLTACWNRFLLYGARATWCKTSWNFLSSKFCSVCFHKSSFLSSKFWNVSWRQLKSTTLALITQLFSAFRWQEILIPPYLCVRLTYLNMYFSSPVDSEKRTFAIVFSCFASHKLCFSLLYLPSEYYIWNSVALPISFCVFCLLLNFL